MLFTVCLRRNNFLKSCYPILKINQRLVQQQDQQQSSTSHNNNNNKKINNNHHHHHHRSPSFYRYFLKFLSDNNFARDVPEELKFRYQQTLKEFEEVHEILNSKLSSEEDLEFTKLAQDEAEGLIERLENFQHEILDHSCADDRDVNECTFEIRAGVGGKEASLFAKELHSLYLKFIAYNGWNVKFNKEDFEQVEIDDNSSLFTETIEVEGLACYRFLRHEAGVHRVQRVPKTEKYGRIHTSTVSVSVIPVRHNLVVIKDSELKFEVKNSSGAGGQNVNRNLTCVRVTHIPTGQAVECQETRFQYLNKEIAIRKIKTLINQLEYERLEKQAKQQKQSQIGIAARSDKIRTYNFPQNRITDHRLALDDGHHTIHNIDGYMAGQECEKLLNMIKKLESNRHDELVRRLRSVIQKQYSETFGKK